MTLIIALIILLSMTRMNDANTFIWDPNNTDNIEIVQPFSNNNPNNHNNNNHHATFSNPSKCVQIPSNLTLCHGIKYDKMRLPNLLYHETMNEVIEQSSSWIQLIKIGCHQDTQLFLCSLFSPVCLDQTIPPCRSLCENVKHNCEPSMLIHGYSWPPMMQCNLFPVQNNMCIESQQVTATTAGNLNESLSLQNYGHDTIRGNKQSSNDNNDNNDRIILDDQMQQRLIQSICDSDWVIKIGIKRIRDKNRKIRIKKYKTLYGTLDRMPPFILTVNKNSTTLIIGSIDSSTSSLPVVTLKTKREKYIVIGRNNDNNNQTKDLSVNLIVSWSKFSLQIKKILRKIKNNHSNVCKKFTKLNTTQQSSLPLLPSAAVSSSSYDSMMNESWKINQNGQTMATIQSMKKIRNRNRKKNSNMARIH